MASFEKENIICVYRQNDSDSFSFAQNYLRIHDLDVDQLVPIPCSNIEILNDYATFETEVEDPIKNAISSGSLLDRNVYGIVLMPFVPGGFYDGDNVVSSTSRISHMKQAYVRNTKNPYYNRQIFKRFDEVDALGAYICSRIDGPATVVERWFENIENTNLRLLATGEFYLDPYSTYSFTDATNYTRELIEFGNNYATRLGLEIRKTIQRQAGRDPFFGSIQDDSFFWGWGADRGSTTFFKTTANLRGFFYNADLNGAFSVRNVTSRSWPLLAIRSGYNATAGSMKADNSLEFLRPTPFMDTLYRGATLGEAFLFSQPLLDCSMAVFGDPLQIYQFPTPIETSTLLPINMAWQNMEDFLAKAIISNSRRSHILENLRNRIARGNDEQVLIDLLYPFDDLYLKYNDPAWRVEYIILTKDFFSFANELNSKQYEALFVTINDYLNYTGNKVSDIVLQTLIDDNIAQTIDAANIRIIGSWQFIVDLEHYSGEFRFYNLELEVAQYFDDFAAGAQIFIRKTFDDVQNWYYEDIDGNYQAFSSNGITSNFAGRKIKYVAKNDELLTRGEYYWFRIRQIDELQEFDWRYFQILIYW